MNEEQALAEELEAILGRVSSIRERLDQLLEEKEEDKRVTWSTRFAVMFGIIKTL